MKQTKTETRITVPDWFLSLIDGALFIIKQYGKCYNCTKTNSYHFKTFKFNNHQNKIFNDYTIWISHEFEFIRLIDTKTMFN